MEAIIILILCAVVAFVAIRVHQDLKRKDPFDHDGDGNPGGSKPKAKRK